MLHANFYCYDKQVTLYISQKGKKKGKKKLRHKQLNRKYEVEYMAYIRN